MRKSGNLTGAWTLGLACLCLGLGLAEEGRSRREPAPAERLAVAKARDAASPRERVAAIKALAALTNAQEARDLRVAETLLEIVRAKDDDLFVRIEALRGLATLQFNLFPNMAPAYTIPLIEVLKDGKEEELLRAEVTKTFMRTLVPGDLPSRQAVQAMLELAVEKRTPPMVRTGAVRASAVVGSYECLPAFCRILGEPEPDPILKEAVLRGFGEVVVKIEDAKAVPVATLLKLNEIAANDKTPVEVRAQALLALAQMKKRGAPGIDLQPILADVLRRAVHADLVIAAVRTLGVLSDEAVLPDLLRAYGEFYDLKNPGRENDVRIRAAIVQALADLLAAQVARRAPHEETVKLVAEKLLALTDPDAERKEVPSVVDGAVFGLRYLYPKRPPFQAYHQPAIERLLRRLLKPAASDPQETTRDSLVALARVDLERLEHWVRWYNAAYPCSKLQQE